MVGVSKHLTGRQVMTKAGLLLAEGPKRLNASCGLNTRPPQLILALVARSVVQHLPMVKDGSSILPKGSMPPVHQSIDSIDLLGWLVAS